MPPRTRAAAARQVSDKEVTYISSDSESAKPAKKRKIEPKKGKGKQPSPEPQPQKPSTSRMTVDEYAMDVDEWSLPTPATSVLSAPKSKAKNAHLKGRKRFMADLEDMKNESAEAVIEMHGLQVKSLRAGDEEGSMELKVLRDGQHLIALNLLIDDTASYPREHTFYSFVQDAEIPPYVLEVVEKVSSASPKPLADTVTRLLASISASFAQGKYVSQEDAYTGENSQDGESESDDAGAYDDDIEYHFSPVGTESQNSQLAILKGHFLSVIEAGFKPGLTRLSDDDMVLSIASPVPSLSIPPRALVAWDRRLLSSYHNLILLISGIRGSYPVLSYDGSYTTGNSHSKLKFHVGLSPSYKPSRDVVLENARNFGLSHAVDEHDFAAKLPEADLYIEPQTAPQLNTDPGRFEKFSLSSSLESLLNSQFISVLQLRLKFQLGWAGAELLHAGSMQSQQKSEDLFGLHEKIIRLADAEEARLRQTYSLPADPLENHGAGELNLPLIAYCYLVRRFTLCSRYCLVCHTKMATSIEALKPYVCDSKLCTYQYYALNFGPSIEYEIRTNPQVVDLLVSLAYVSAREHQLSDSLPVGLGLRVPLPKELPPPIYLPYLVPRSVAVEANQKSTVPPVGSDGLCDFDDLPLPLMRAAITEMIDSLPSITDMKQHLDRKVKGKVRPQLKTIDEKVLPAAWSILRWCVASSTAYLEEISDGDEMISNVESSWRQFRFSVGAPDKEARFKAGLEQVQKVNANARQYPALYGFHGSSLKNWHSIIRQGLLVKQAVNGRAHGDGVYFAKDGAISMGHYAQNGSSRWTNSETRPLTCVALAEIVNSPNEFTSNNPYYVVKQVDWILCRYLLVKTDATFTVTESGLPLEAPKDVEDASQYVPLDPNQPLTMGAKKILIPEQSHKLQMLLEARKAEEPEHELFDDEDEGVLGSIFQPGSQVQSQEQHGGGQALLQRAAADDWKHNEEWCDENTYQLLPPPTDSTPHAALALQKELRAMLKEQEKAEKGNGLKELGWYMPPELMGDNLFRWMLELHSFDPALPIAQDMVRHDVPSLLFEIRFPPSFPIQPPFFRIIKPRFLPFIQGGGGHVTGGGSICMDLLVSDGWLPSYNLSAILLQIRLAVSNLDPRPARLASNWDRPYSAAEALEGFKRAARTHGWTVPDGLERLVR